MQLRGAVIHDAKVGNDAKETNMGRLVNILENEAKEFVFFHCC